MYNVEFDESLVTGNEMIDEQHKELIGTVLEGLLEAQELDDRSIHTGMQAQAALVGADGAVELNAEATVHLNLARIVHPGYTELDKTLRLDQALQHTVFLVFRVLFHQSLQAFQNLAHGLQELRLIGVTGFHLCIYTGQVIVFEHNVLPLSNDHHYSQRIEIYCLKQSG